MIANSDGDGGTDGNRNSTTPNCTMLQNCEAGSRGFSPLLCPTNDLMHTIPSNTIVLLMFSFEMQDRKLKEFEDGRQQRIAEHEAQVHKKFQAS